MTHIPSINALLERRDDANVMLLSLLLHDIEYGLSLNTITQAEYAEFIADIERLRKIIELKNNLELNQLIHDAIQGVVMLAKMVKP